jgi:hypothetical protein
MNKEALKEKQRARRRQERLKRYLIIAVSIFGLGVVVWGILAPNLRPEIGEAAEELAAGHVIEGEDPGPFNTDPPTSGAHYAADLEAGFYEEADITGFGSYPEGYLVHNLEHGYVIFWYNCDLLSETECSELKAEIRDVMDRENYFKVIGFPWSSIDVPVVMTSWTRSLSFDAFDTELARQFVRTYRNQAPEPHAP